MSQFCLTSSDINLATPIKKIVEYHKMAEGFTHASLNSRIRLVVPEQLTTKVSKEEGKRVHFAADHYATSARHLESQQIYQGHVA